MAQILIADTLNDSASLKRILSGHEPVVVNTMRAAQAQLQEQSFDLIVVALHFDGSHMFELIREVRRSSNNSKKPIICYCARDTKLARLMHECLQIVTRTLGAWMYLSEHEYNVIQNPDAELRRIIERCLIAEKRKESLRRRMDLHRQRLEIQELRRLLIEQESSTDVEQFSSELTYRLESVLKEVSNLQVSTETLRTSISSSRDLKDRVSEDVIMCEDNMTRLEEVQSLEEACQTTCESDLREFT
ncbi:MAG: hypothetical protein K2X29_12700 [Candidatus Obscuribacterales bacterium]|nr:hypothetical protein [Candidatus Obscuribacterales bacterium]